MEIMGELILSLFYISATIDHKYCCNAGEILISSNFTSPLLSDLDRNVSLFEFTSYGEDTTIYKD